MLYVAAEQNDKRDALAEDLRSPHRTGTGWVINKVSFHLKNGFIAAVRLSLQKVEVSLVHPDR